MFQLRLELDGGVVEGRFVLVGNTRRMQQLTGEVVAYLDMGKYRLPGDTPRRYLR